MSTQSTDKEPASRLNRSRADTARARLLEAALPHVPFEGWSDSVLRRAARDAGMSEDEAALYCPEGVLSLIVFWWRELDDQAREAILSAERPAKIRERIRDSVLARLDAAAGQEDAMARARARLLLPDGLATGAELAWNTSDMIWRAIGDTSTDANWYSKRAILTGVWTSTLAIWLSERELEKPQTRAFLDRRIANVMEFEKVKAGVNKQLARLPDFAAMAARLRYGTR
ncbi:MAG: COQ9 family protein [Caulobacterales bacterium]|uniref:COQ9 family protein n=1 Tax=Glycocaulis sp. TaxID=1969725 RepID=UPI003FA05552